MLSGLDGERYLAIANVRIIVSVRHLFIRGRIQPLRTYGLRTPMKIV